MSLSLTISLGKVFKSDLNSCCENWTKIALRFSMLFACGVGSGLFFFSVSEPVSHYTGGLLDDAKLRCTLSFS